MSSSLSLSPPEKGSKIRTQCTICHRNSQPVFEKYCYWIRACQNCDHRFVDLAPDATHAQQVYGGDYFEGGGTGDSDYLAEAELLRNHGRCYGLKVNIFTKPGRLLIPLLNLVPDGMNSPYPAEDLFWILLQKSS